MHSHRVLFAALAVILLGAASPARSALPSILVPQVKAGEQFHYKTSSIPAPRQPYRLSLNTLRVRTYTDKITAVSPSSILWTREYTSLPQPSFDSFAVDTHGVVSDAETHKPVLTRGFAYNTMVFGTPVQPLEVGASWSNIFTSTDDASDTSETWQITVTQLQPDRGLVRLHLVRKNHTDGTHMMLGTSVDGEQTGDAVFVRGILTDLKMEGSNSFLDLNGPGIDQFFGWEVQDISLVDSAP